MFCVFLSLVTLMLNEMKRQKRHTIEVNGHFWVWILVILKNDAFTDQSFILVSR